MHKSFFTLSAFFVLRCMAWIHEPVPRAEELNAIGTSLDTARKEYRDRVDRWYTLSNNAAASEAEVQAAKDAKDQAWIGFEGTWKSYGEYADAPGPPKPWLPPQREANDKK